MIFVGRICIESGRICKESGHTLPAIGTSALERAPASGPGNGGFCKRNGEMLNVNGKQRSTIQLVIEKPFPLKIPFI